jgi:hypothetical protein
VDNTAAIISIQAEELTKTKVLNANVQGKAAGVQVISSDFIGSSPSVIIRGFGNGLRGRTPFVYC